MSADLLRRAAALMRERAAAATPGRWPEMKAWQGRLDANSIHAASWHPAVALAVADQLDAMAAVVEEAAGSPLEIVAAGLAEKSVAVARAYLGEDA